MNDLSAQSSLNLTIPQRPRVAILVDGDNVPHSALAGIEAKAAVLGNPILRRVYADMGLHKDWASETSYLAIHSTTTAGKNRADMHLVIGALDIAHRGVATHFLIMSDDRDFGPLVAHLREIGMQVEWAGKPKAVIRKIPAITIAPKVTALSPLDHRIYTLLCAVRTGLTLVHIGNAMKGETVQKQTAKASWRAYFQSKPELYSLMGAGAATLVTMKNP
jgi:hypothetical protein